ncbi:hypothetical protein JW930_00495 [Candidatus Woesearchaeota archaeon]|nr:hypothetical protein [Candidatus Woesearchaeota archaeon]
MQKQDFFFIVSFFLTLSLLLFFLGSSITGFAMQSMHCKDGICREICRTNAECDKGICCDQGGFGVCKQECDSQFMYQPATIVSPEISYQGPYLEKPQSVSNIFIYIGLIILALSIGAVYFFERKKH